MSDLLSSRTVMPSPSDKRLLLSKRQCPECPPCFNCQLPTDSCVNGGACAPSGACECFSGWGKHGAFCSVCPVSYHNWVQVVWTARNHYAARCMLLIDRFDKETSVFAMTGQLLGSSEPLTVGAATDTKRVHVYRWAGVNCNVCQNDQACRSFKGENATCIKTAIGLKSMHAWCDTTSKLPVAQERTEKKAQGVLI